MKSIKRTGIIYMGMSPSGKIYIGRTVKSLKRRILEHCSYAFRKKKNGQLSQSPMSCAIRKYGINNFSWVVVHSQVPSDLLNNLEIRTIQRKEMVSCLEF